VLGSTTRDLNSAGADLAMFSDYLSTRRWARPRQEERLNDVSTMNKVGVLHGLRADHVAFDLTETRVSRARRACRRARRRVAFADESNDSSTTRGRAAWGRWGGDVVEDVLAWSPGGPYVDVFRRLVGDPARVSGVPEPSGADLRGRPGVAHGATRPTRPSRRAGSSLGLPLLALV